MPNKELPLKTNQTFPQFPIYFYFPLSLFSTFNLTLQSLLFSMPYHEGSAQTRELQLLSQVLVLVLQHPWQQCHYQKLFLKKKKKLWTSLVAQQLRIHLPMQGTRVRALVREDPTCRGATKPVSHNY